MVSSLTESCFGCVLDCSCVLWAGPLGQLWALTGFMWWFISTEVDDSFALVLKLGDDASPKYARDKRAPRADWLKNIKCIRERFLQGYCSPPLAHTKTTGSHPYVRVDLGLMNYRCLWETGNAVYCDLDHTAPWESLATIYKQFMTISCRDSISCAAGDIGPYVQ